MADSFFDKIYKDKTQHTPDVLSCLANLSNDEVFTPPDVVKKMLDLLPQELFCDPDTTFLDPACKTGVFLREIAKRLLVGLQDKIPDLQQRIDHIFHKQLYGIAITELTSLLTRRSLYCSKYPNGPYSITHFDDAEGNIRYRRINHTWVNGKCKYCGASKEQWGREDTLETYAYELIHTDNPERLFNMKFDVIIGNPPYQLNTSKIEGKANAIPIYHHFIKTAINLNSRYLCMIIPSRWMTGGTGTLNAFRDYMIHNKHVMVLHDYFDSKKCFPGVEVKGGICYFLMDKLYSGECEIYSHSNDSVKYSKRLLATDDDDIFIRYNELSSVKNRVSSFNEATLDTIASPQTPYGLLSNAFKTSKEFFTTTKTCESQYKVYGLGENLKREILYTSPDFHLDKDYNANSYKLFIPEVYGSGELGEIPPRPIVGKPGDICTQTFRQFGYFKTEDEAKNLLTYSYTKFFRALVGIMKHTHHAPAKVYQFVPLQDFSKPWTDEELYKKYKLTQEEINFIESMIRPMDLSGGDN